MGLIIGVVLVVSAIYALLNNDKKEATGPTGGSGALPVGSLVLQGYDIPTTNSPTKTPVGKYLSRAQQSNIRLYLEALLYNKKPQSEYRGTIVSGSPSIDYRTNILTFKVEITDPAVTYTIHYTITGTEMRVFDEQGKEIKPPGA